MTKDYTIDRGYKIMHISDEEFLNEINKFAVRRGLVCSGERLYHNNKYKKIYALNIHTLANPEMGVRTEKRIFVGSFQLIYEPETRYELYYKSEFYLSGSTREERNSLYSLLSDISDYLTIRTLEKIKDE